MHNKSGKKIAAVITAALILLPSSAGAEEMAGSISGFGFQIAGGGYEDTRVTRKIADTCTDPGEKDGDFRCIKTFSNGSKVVVVTDQEHHGSDFKKQARIAEFNAEGQTVNSRTVRQKTAYVYKKGGRSVRTDFFDIVTRPRGKQITREVILYEYNSRTEKLKTLSWTSYEQIGSSQFAMIKRHILLSYDEDGNPLRGRVEKWENQVPVHSLFNWDRLTDGIKTLDLKAWELWKDQIVKASPRQVV